MQMTDKQKYSVVLEELGELLQNKNTTISCQRWQIDELKAKLEAAERERDDARQEFAAAGKHLAATIDVSAQLRCVNDVLRKCVDLETKTIVDFDALLGCQSYIQTALEELEAGGAA